MSGQQLQGNTVLSTDPATSGEGKARQPWQPQCPVLDAGILVLPKMWDLCI